MLEEEKNAIIAALASLDLFHFQEEAVGQIFWHHKGWTVFTKLKEYIRENSATTTKR